MIMLIKGNYLIIVSGPSGVGKSSITSKLLSDCKNLDFSVSYTTRKKRPIEINKKDYNFSFICSTASDTLTRAIGRAVYSAKGIKGLKAVKDLVTKKE